MKEKQHPGVGGGIKIGYWVGVVAGRGKVGSMNWIGSDLAVFSVASLLLEGSPNEGFYFFAACVCERDFGMEAGQQEEKDLDRANIDTHTHTRARELSASVSVCHLLRALVLKRCRRRQHRQPAKTPTTTTTTPS